MAHRALSETWEVQARFNKAASRIRIGYNTFTPHALSFTVYGLHGARVHQVSRDTVLEGVRFRRSSDAVLSIRLLQSMGVFCVRLNTRGRLDWIDIEVSRLRDIVNETVALVPPGQEHLCGVYDWDQGLERIHGQDKTWMGTPGVARCGVCGMPAAADEALCGRCR